MTSLIHTPSSSTSAIKAIRILSNILAFSVLVLIFAGALVKSHDAGLSVPDWPTTYGYNMFLFPWERWVDGIFYEHGHRLLASGVGFLTLILTICIFRYESRRFVKQLSAIALASVIIQGILGGLTVRYGLPHQISIAHGLLAQTLLLMAVTIAYAQSEEWSHGEPPSESLIRRSRLYIVMIVGAIYIQLILGAIVRHTGAGLASPDFPTLGGTWFPVPFSAVVTGSNTLRANLGLPPLPEGLIALHCLHRAWGLITVILITVTTTFVRREYTPTAPISRSMSVLVAIVVLQFILGATTVVLGREPLITSFHVATGALLLGCSFLVALRTSVSSFFSATSPTGSRS